jgi:hypothetical protein
MVDRRLRLNTTSPSQGSREPGSRKPSLQRGKQQRDPLSEEHRHNAHDIRQLLRPRYEPRPMCQSERLVERPLCAHPARNSPARSSVPALNILHLDRHTLHLPARKHLHCHHSHVPQQPVLIHDSTLDQSSSTAHSNKIDFSRCFGQDLSGTGTNRLTDRAKKARQLNVESGRKQVPRKKPRWRSNLLISILVFIIIAAGIGLWTTDNYVWRLPTPPSHSTPKALIIDQLALNYPDPSFITNVTQALVNGGYSVTYSGPSTNAVNMFRQLPSQGYNLIIIRAHQGSGQAIITSQPYSPSLYESDQESGALAAADVEGGPLYFAITPRFVSNDMQGTFPGTTVIVMGCAALQGTQDLAVAFLDKGANFFVGWDGSVTIIHTDISTVNLVQLLSNGKGVPDATSIAGTADPVYGARLKYLDWNGLVQSRIDNMISLVTLWSFLGAILVFGPLSVFVAPKLFDALDQLRYRASRSKKQSAKKQSAEPKHESQ